MFGYFQLEERKVSLIKLFQSVSKFAFITLSYFSIFLKHLRLFLNLVFLWILFSLLFLLIFSHLNIHLSSHLFRICCLHGLFLLLSHVLFQFFSLLFLLSLFLLFNLFQFNLNKQIFLKRWEILNSFNALRRCDCLPIINL